MGQDKEKQVGAVAVHAAIPSGSKGGRSRASQLELMIPPWQGARYGVPYMSGEVAILSHGTTESTGSRLPPVQPSADLDAPPTAPQTVAVAAVEGARFDDVTDRVLPEPEAVTGATNQPLAALARRLGRGKDKDSAAGHSQAE